MRDMDQSWATIPLEDIRKVIAQRGYRVRFANAHIPGQRICDMWFPDRGWLQMSQNQSDDLALRHAYRIAVHMGYLP